jgi:hypothetical protein
MFVESDQTLSWTKGDNKAWLEGRVDSRSFCVKAAHEVPSPLTWRGVETGKDIANSIRPKAGRQQPSNQCDPMNRFD